MSAASTLELILPRRRRVTPQPTGGAMTGPADFAAGQPTDPHEVMNTVLHHALRRDLRRLSETLRTPVTGPRRAALAEHVGFVLRQLQHHHTAEDELIWPAVLRRRPDLVELFAQLAAEHGALDAVISRLTRSGAAWTDEFGQAAMRTALAGLELVLEPHLEHEEAEAMPLICTVLTAADWATIDKHLHRPTLPSKTAETMLWMLDDLDPRQAAVVEGLLPRPLWRTLQLRYASGWRRRQALLWG